MSEIGKELKLEELLEGTTSEDFKLTDEDRCWLNSSVGKECIRDDETEITNSSM